MSELKLGATWTNDCQGKKDYDGDILSISTRFWPKVGGAHIGRIIEGRLVFEPMVSEKASAHASLVIWNRDRAEGESLPLADIRVEGDSFEEIAPQIEAWAQTMMDRAVKALVAEFKPEGADEFSEVAQKPGFEASEV